MTTTTSYVIALGSNRRGRHGNPEREIRAALALLKPVAVSPILATRPLGPSRRRFANAAAIIETGDDPPTLLVRLKAIERAFGRRRGQSWAARVIDLDIILWSGGAWSGPQLTVPHPHFRTRDFVLTPLLAITPGWRDPISGLSVRHLAARLRRPQ
ncbi:MAG: 2-amino-4-hydroxy-6-hydroxymethyldihydropteridine diphosphokinase [Sphingomonas sp.]|uniref:2-amino-4-hydroxy-6- hydroxymethyldihydropteridine diphosphokinase n=1 Tax=Sphingomonas sp. TaxID=28214 RepID=UPI0025EC9616|nr:2-amino-4-hydroxy-6-hydroxymethyldihydropteridine diphosphokinase [Sphingomonas sp.]MBX3565813.1 2-amino-4-hydroxy-6-hydroxymethyldihydropteridine diphosphokinase [Sphingomonas sp.]